MVCGDRSDSAIAAWGRHDGTELQKKNMASPFKTLRNAVDISDTGMSSSYFSTMPGENLSTDRANHCHSKALGYVPASASVTSGGAAPPERVSAKDNARGRSTGAPGRRRPRTAPGEQTALPPVLYLSRTNETSHPRPDLDEFVLQYRRAGGQVDLALFEGEGEGFLTRNLTSPAAQQALEQIIAFIHQHLG